MTVEAPTKRFLSWQDFAEMFDCGRSKALLLMHEVGVIHIGHAAFVRAEDLDSYLEKNDAIDITWPKSKARRKATRNGR